MNFGVLNFCPENDTLWNVWSNEDLIGRVKLIDGMARFIAGEMDVPSDEYRMNTKQKYAFNALEMGSIHLFLEYQNRWKGKQFQDDWQGSAT